MKSLSLLKPHLVRLVQQPPVEIHRVVTYTRHSNRREGYLAFQRSFVDRKLKRVRKLAPVVGAMPRSSSSNVPYRGQGELGQLLDKYGSDKASNHDYDRVYENLARLVGPPAYVLEIGLGTTGSGPSSMGSGGHPGASVRALRDWGAEVVGADIDETILVNEPGIASFRVDQLVPRTLKNLTGRLSKPLDLAIVDGLHTPEADLNSILALAPHMAVNGLVVVEDIEDVPEIVNMWRDVLGALPGHFRAALVKTKVSLALLLLRADNQVVAEWSDLYPSDSDPVCTS